MKESAASAYKRMFMQRKMEFKDNADTCKNYFTDGCSFPWCDCCANYGSKETTSKEKHR